MWTILLLCLSNVFMTFAWYGHLKFFPNHAQPMWVIILFSWGIALVEYCFAVPANRIGSDVHGFQTAQLKIMQEIITLLVFGAFSVIFLKEKLAWNHAAGFVCMIAAAAFIFNPFAKKSTAAEPPAVQVQTTQPAEL
ncbi:MAG: DMT family protein [Tepidisphaeraceae bacterium]